MPDILFAHMPWGGLGLGLLLSLCISALGFRRVDWFISIGYAFSIAAQAVVFPALYHQNVDVWTLAQSALLLAYGARLGSFLIARERSPSFADELVASKERGARIKGGVAFAIWISVSLLYVLMYFPALASLASAARGQSLPTVLPGIVVMAAGLALEALADAQKSRAKAQNPRAFVRSGLFSIVRSPNYFGEMLFWLGAFISGIAAYQTVGDWVFAGAGFIAIELVMLGSARRLELKQAGRYAANADYQAYARTVPVLFPLLPIYSLKNLKIYLG